MTVRQKDESALVRRALMRSLRAVQAHAVRIAKTTVARSMPKYEVIIYWSEPDQAFIAEVPELPGCSADGATQAEALAHAQVVIQEWIETAKSLGRSIPSPRGRLSFA